MLPKTQPLQGHRPFSRRRFITSALAGLSCTPQLLRAAPSTALPNAQLLIGGTLHSIPGQFGELATNALSHGLGLNLPIQLSPDIGLDGVKVANEFDSNVAADGQTALVVPGSAFIAAQTGDPRTHYDFTRWIPLLVAHTASVVVTRTDTHQNFAHRLRSFFHGRSLKLAVSHPTGNELSALLGLTLLDLHPTPVPGFATAQDALQALHNGLVDAVQILPTRGDAPLLETLKNLPEGVAPLYHTGDLSGTPLNDIPNFLEISEQMRRRPPEGQLFSAWQAVSAGVCTPFAVALPMLTPPPLVERWKNACADASDDDSIRHWAETYHFSLETEDNAAPFFSRIRPTPESQLALRRWIAMNTPRWRLGQETRL
ncbi:hypothetical protein [Neokomagataea anthophila]|uniref:ABC transporter substrate-binding protein n=1 Tax=Neokomagataea anthophila TaxID=2826925 RepID=A0ABS5E8T7_9PROT|nr:hypothetical protein [Neokomagataea anthophila]MBR0559913.1 hypothetical protein [Neokomagataea anthophila]